MCIFRIQIDIKLYEGCELQNAAGSSNNAASLIERGTYRRGWSQLPMRQASGAEVPLPKSRESPMNQAEREKGLIKSLYPEALFHKSRSKSTLSNFCLLITII